MSTNSDQALSRANDEGGVTSKLREKIDYRYRKAASRGRGHYCPWRIGLEAVKQSADELDRATEEHGEQRMVPVYAVPEDVEAGNETCFTLHDHPPFGADFLTLFRAAAPQPEQEGDDG